MNLLRWWFLLRFVIVYNAMRLRCANLPSNFKYYKAPGYCYFWVSGLPTATYDQSVAACRQAHVTAELASFPDETLLTPVFDNLEMQESGCPLATYCNWVRLNVIRVSDVGNTQDNWKWILPDGLQIELAAATINAQQIWLSNTAMTNVQVPLTNLFYSSASPHVFTSQSPTNPYAYMCQARSSTVKWSGKTGHESNSSVISEVVGISGVMNCAEKCVQSLACLSFTFVNSNGGICRFHWKTIAGLLLNENVNAKIYETLS